MKELNYFFCFAPFLISCAASISLTTPDATTTLVTSNSKLALSVNNTGVNSALTGNPRTISITNSGNATVTGISISYPTWPSGTIATSNCGLSLTASSSCTITVTPGSAATSSCNTGIAPTAGTITVSATAISSVQVTVVVLSYGCIYESGFVYSIDDSLSNYPASGSIGGKVLAQSDQVNPNVGILWSANTSGTYDNGVSIWGIDDSSTSSAAAPNTGSAQPATLYTGQSSCNALTNGSCNTNNIVTYYSLPVTNPAVSNSLYAAGVCKNTISGYSDWYLPAICEWAYGSNGCGSQFAPTTQNIRSNLVDNGNIGSLTGNYWSSTEYSSTPATIAWHSFIGMNSSIFTKSYLFGIRCARSF